MTEQKKATGFGTRLVNIINAFDTSPTDYVFDNIRHSRTKLQELEARVARLEGVTPAVSEVREREVVR